MEEFNEPHHKIREKNVYLLHLDVPRIVLISMAIIGVIIAAFLLGMNFVNNETTQIASINENDPLLNKAGELPLITPDLPEPPAVEDKGDKSAGIEEGIIGDGKTAIPGGKEPATDLVTADNMHEIITPPKNTGKSHKTENKIDAKETEHKIVSHEKNKNHAKDRKRRDKQKVVEVSSQTDQSHAKLNSFSIQVVSYDSKSKANTEMQRLKSMNYDAYVDRTIVNGTKYYRVRIGPIGSHKKAEKLLKDVQEVDRYSGSYLIHE